MQEGTAFFQNSEEALNSPFAKRLFGIEGVEGVFFGSDFITITKSDELDWQIMKPMLLSSIMDHFNSDEETINSDTSHKGEESLKENMNDSDIVKQIKSWDMKKNNPSSTTPYKFGNNATLTMDIEEN